VGGNHRAVRSAWPVAPNVRHAKTRDNHVAFRHGVEEQPIPPESSALFVLFKSATEDKVLAEIETYKPWVLKTSLSNEDEARLRAALGQIA